MVLTPSERKGLFGQFRFDITDNVQWYVKALGNRRESTNQAGPERCSSAPMAPPAIRWPTTSWSRA